MAKKYLLYIHNDRFEKEQRKSNLVNELLDEHYTKHVYDTGKAPKPIQPLLNIPGVKRASDIVCTGHPNFRRSCGRKGCIYG